MCTLCGYWWEDAQNKKACSANNIGTNVVKGALDKFLS